MELTKKSTREKPSQFKEVGGGLAPQLLLWDSMLLKATQFTFAKSKNGFKTFSTFDWKKTVYPLFILKEWEEMSEILSGNE